MTDLLIRNAELGGVSGVDIRISGGTVTEIGRGITPAGAEVIDADGGAVLPGLTDHHLHLHAMAADAVSVRCGPPHVRDRGDLARALERAQADDNGWVRGVGYIETVAGELDSSVLDTLHGQRPVRIQHRSGAMWVLNGAAMAAARLAETHHPGVELDHAGAPTGRVWRADTWLRERLPRSQPPRLATIGAALARFGITTVTDATPTFPPSRSRPSVLPSALANFPSGCICSARRFEATRTPWRDASAWARTRSCWQIRVFRTSRSWPTSSATFTRSAAPSPSTA